MFALGVTDPNTQWDIGDATLHLTARGFDTLAATLGSDPATGVTGYLLKDHLGTPRASYGQTRNLLSKNEYSPYGIPEVNLGAPSPIGYTGHYHDTETNLNYAPYRYYNPQNTRWLKRDPLGMIDGPNMYAYVKGNPVNSKDIWGLTEWTWSPPGAGGLPPGATDSFPWSDVGYGACMLFCRAESIVGHAVNSGIGAIGQEICNSFERGEVRNTCRDIVDDLVEALDDEVECHYDTCEKLCEDASGHPGIGGLVDFFKNR